MGFEDQITLITDGEPVSASVTNGPTLALDAKIRYLYSLIQASSTGAAIFGREVTIEPDAQVGMPVFYNDLTHRFERALAKTESTPTEGALVTAPSARPWGVVYSKANATLADLVFYGYVALDISTASGGDEAAGVYYLSGTTPGRLTRQRPPVSVPVLRSDGTGNVLVMPQFVDLMERHTHYRFSLTCRPAGSTTPPSPGSRHVITAPNVSLPGWLPASHASFDGLAPAGTAFGYNLAAHPALADVWPPIPASQAYLEIDRGLVMDVGGTGVPLGAGGLCIIDRNGIWWRSDCYGDVPWPTDLDTSFGSLPIDTTTIECPRFLAMEVQLYFTRLNFVSNDTVVTSLTSASDRLTVRCVDGADAATGDLVLDLDIVSTIEEGVAGYVVVKELDNDVVRRGPVCEGIYALGGNVSLTGPATTVVGSDTVFHGPVGIAVETDATREVSVQLIRLDGVEEQFYLDITYLGFRADMATQLRAKIEIPADVAIPDLQLALRLLILGRSLGDLPTLTMTARRLPRPTGAPVQLPDENDEFDVTIDTTGTLTLGSQYIEAIAEPFDVVAGDIVFFTVARAADDGYPAEVGLLQLSGSLASGV